MRRILFYCIIISGIALLFAQCNGGGCKKNENEGAIHEVEADTIAPEMRYGLMVDSFMIEHGTIKRNEVLSTILMEHGVSARVIDNIAKQTEVFDVRQMRSGNPYSIFKSKDSLPVAKFFVYEHSNLDYVVISLQDSITINVGEKESRIEAKVASGSIQSNLWDAMVENNINPMMSIELSEIYAWSIDFFGLRKGDEFFVIYDERFVDSTTVGIERIHAALFNHQNRDYYAIYFVQDSSPNYFDEEGNSLQRTFLKAPLKYSRISSGFTHNRHHPVLKITRPHTGVDYAAPEGTPVYSVGDGFIKDIGFQKNGAGNYVKIKHNSVYSTQYAHLKAFAKGLREGQHVQQGELIGYVGKTGLATGPHLDFRFFKNGQAVDPLKVEAPPVEPVKKINREEFEKIKNSYLQMLQQQREEFHKKDSIVIDSL